MKKLRRVAVYGKSLNMAVLVASLKADTTLEVLYVDLDSPNARQSLDENDIAVIVFDLSNPAHKLDVNVLRNRPDLLLIGVDPGNYEILVLSSRSMQAHSMADLVDVIHQKESSARNSYRENHKTN
jgi:hypothetical protein